VLNAARLLSRTTVPSPTRAAIQTRSFLATSYNTFAEKKAAAKSTDTTTKSPKRTAKKTASTAKGDETSTSRAKKVAKQESKPTRIRKEDRPPKAPKSGFLRYWVDYYKQHGPASSTAESQALIKTCTVSWKELDEAQKKKYLDEAATDREAYKLRMKEWLENIDVDVLKAINAKRKARGTSQIRPPSPVRSVKLQARPYNIFLKEFLDNYERPTDGTTIRQPQLFKEAGQKWREMSAEQKEEYQRASSLLNQQLKSEAQAVSS